MKKMLIFCSFSALFFLPGCFENRQRQATYSEAYKNWPQVNFKDARVLIASEPGLPERGFAIAEDGDFEKTIIIFPNVSEGTVFINRDQGYSAVHKDLKIVFLDAGMNILKEDILGKVDGFSVAPEGTFMAIEGLPVELPRVNIH